jgi:UDP-N-acetylmuramate dehydrogenase
MSGAFTDLLQSSRMPTPTGAEGLFIRESEPLKPYTTFKIGGPSRYFLGAGSINELREGLKFAQKHSLPQFVLGGGSNILVSDQGFDGLVIHPAFQGLTFQPGSPGLHLKVDAAEAWDDVVRFAVEHAAWGIENLSHIPGQAGAALVQNIGAYGQQVSDVLESACVLEVVTGKQRVLSAAECHFGYRRSIFNTTARGQYIIAGLTLELSHDPRRMLDYPDVRSYFRELGVNEPTLTEIRQAIISIRDKKFPFPREEKGGNAGSFFKNLSVEKEGFLALRARVKNNFSLRDVDRMDEIRNRFPSADRIKIPAAFLIDICGLKGHRIGGAQVNENQPLVLLNMGGATAADVLALARHVRKTVWARTGAELVIEPELVGFSEQELAEFNDFKEGSR